MRLPFRPAAVVRPVAFVVVALAIFAAWQAYRTADALHVGFPEHFWLYGTPLLPLYADPTGVGVGARRDAIVIATATAVVAALGTALCVARRFATLSCLLVAFVGVWTTNVAVGLLRDDYAGLVKPFSRRGLEYHTDVPAVADAPLMFIRSYPELARRRQISHHAGTHPPGAVLFLWAGEKIFGPAATPPAAPRELTPRQVMLRRMLRVARGPPLDRTLDAAVWLAVTFTALGVLPAYWLATAAGGAAAARRMPPLYVAAPNLILFGATSMDGVFLVFNLVALAAGVAAIRRRSYVGPVVAGAALWVAAFMTYAALAVVVLLVCLALVDAIRHLCRPAPRGFAAALSPEEVDVPGEEDRRFARAVGAVARCAAIGVVFVLCQLVAQRAIGYDLGACVESAMRVDMRGLRITGYESRELWACLSLGNAFAVVVGSGVAAGALAAVGLLSRVRHPLRARLTRFGWATLGAIVALAASTLFTLETERVLLCLTPAILIAATTAYRGPILWALAPLALVAQTIWTEVYFRTWW